MPLCTLKTNVPRSRFRNDFEEKFAKSVAELLQKPLEKVIISVEPQITIGRGGKTNDLFVWLSIHTIGRFNEGSNPKYGKVLKEYLAAALSLDETDIIISLHDLPATHLF